MLKRILQRFLLALVAFLVASLVTGIGITAGLECLLVFSVVYVGGAAYQQHTLAQRQPRPRRSRTHVRHDDERTDDVIRPQAFAADWPSATWSG